MDLSAAQLLVKSLLGRLDSRSNYFDLPSGRLSAEEVEALRVLSGSSAAHSTTASPTQLTDAPVELTPASGPRISQAAAQQPLALNTEVFERVGPAENQLRICLDFGTAMSKAWASGRNVGETLPLVIGTPAGMGETLAVPSSIFIADSGRIYLGQDAERQHRAEVRPGRARFDNIKRMLSDGQVDSDIYTLPLRAGIDPTDSGLTQGDLLVLYLAWLTDLSERALGDAITATSGAFSYGGESLRSVVRRFAIPCFEDADDDRVRGPARAKWAGRVMRDALLRAQVLADSLSGTWQQLTTTRLAPLVVQLHQIDVQPISQLLADDAEIREPIAAGASRFDSVLVAQNGPATRPSRRLLMVVDAGAGTTDFAMFQAITPAGESEPRYAFLRHSVRMSGIAGNEVDAILRPLFIESCGIIPESGNPLNDEDFAYLKTDLDSQIRDLKRLLFERQTIDIDLKPNAHGTFNLATLVTEPKMAQRGQELRRIRDDIVKSVFTTDQLNDMREYNRTGSPYPIYVLLTGGSSGLPIVQALARGELELERVHFKFLLVDRLPDWINRLPTEASQRLADAYPQCAVAIGGSAAALPLELADLDSPITPPPPGDRKLERIQISGV